MRCTLALLMLVAGSWGVARGQDADANLKAAIDQAELTLKKANVQPNGPALLAFFQQRTLSPQDEEKLKQLVLKLGDQSYPARVLAMTKLLKAGSLAMPFLQFGLKAEDQEIVHRAEECLNYILEHSDGELISAAAYLLAHHKPTGAAKVLLDYLPFAAEDDVVKQVRDALDQLAIKDNKADPAVVAALKDKFGIRRGAAAAALAPLADQREAVAALLKDPEPRVRLWVSLALLKAKDKRAVPVLIGLLNQLPEREVWSVEESLLRLAGESAPTVEVSKDGKPGNIGLAWEKWLKANDGGIDKMLKDFSDAGAYIGYTLFTQMPLVGGVFGDVSEMGPKKNALWSLTGLRYPVDAAVSGPKRVLIAEYLNRRVVEMDFTGKVLWHYEIDNPILCQPLLNGNIFIASRKQLIEVSRDHKVKFNYTHPGMYIAAARKMPNGEVLFVDNIGKLTHLDNKGNAKGPAITVGRVYTLGGHIDVLPGNRVLVPEYINHKVVEYTLQGEIKWWVPVNWPTSAMRLPNGQTLVASMINQKLLKYDYQTKNASWEHTTTGRPWCARGR